MMTDPDMIFSRLPGRFRQYVRRNELLANHTFLGIGGEADFWIELATTEELEQLVSFCGENRVPLLMIGRGTNLLFADRGVRGVVARIAARSSQIIDQGDGTARVVADAGLTWFHLVYDLVSDGWGDLEFAMGIPGTLGGAVVTNARARNAQVGEHLEWVEVLDARGSALSGDDQSLSIPQIRRYTSDLLDMQARQSRWRAQRSAHITPTGQLVPAPHVLIDPPEIIVRLALRVSRREPLAIRERLEEGLAQHKQLDSFARHAGPIFKDPLGGSASQLIEQAGMKGFVHGPVQVSLHNSNFLVNREDACAVDVANTILLIHQQVLSRLGVDLAVDIELAGEWEPITRLGR